MSDKLRKLRAEAQATIARIDKALADLTEKPTPKRPFRRGEPVITWDDEKYKFVGFFVKHADGGFVVSGNPDLFYSLTMKWRHCEHLPPFIDWDLIDEYYGWVAECDSGVVAAWRALPEVGSKGHYGTIVAVHKRPEKTK